MHFTPLQIVGHTFWGQIYFNLPLVLVIALIFHYVIKKPLILHMPYPICSWYGYLLDKKLRISDSRSLIKFIMSALIGMFSHIFLDSFTHQSGFFVQHFVILSHSVDILNYSMPFYKLLQHGGTLLGGLVILIYFIYIRDKRGVYRTIKNNKNKWVFWIGTLANTITVLYFILTFIHKISIGTVIVTSITGMFIGILIMSVISKLSIN